MLRGRDENQAKCAALERFGDIHTIAGQLWWDAMKEIIMKMRLRWCLGFTAFFVVILFCPFTLISLFEIIRNL